MTDDTDPGTLHLLLEREEDARDDAERALQKALDHARSSESKVDQLVQYRAEYEQRWQARFAQGGTVALLQCYQGFMVRLEQAIAQQRTEHARAQEQATARRGELVAAQVRVAALRKLMERREDARQRQADRREQKAADEAAARSRLAGPGASRLADAWPRAAD